MEFSPLELAEEPIATEFVPLAKDEKPTAVLLLKVVNVLFL